MEMCCNDHFCLSCHCIFVYVFQAAAIFNSAFGSFLVRPMIILGFLKTFLCCIITELSLCSLRVLWHLEMLSDILYVWTPCPRRPLTFDVFGLNMNNLGHFGAVLKVGCSSNGSDFTVCHSACDFMNELIWTFNKTCVVCVCFSGDCRDSCAAAVFCK